MNNIDLAMSRQCLARCSLFSKRNLSVTTANKTRKDAATTINPLWKLLRDDSARLFAIVDAFDECG